jgi:hypothetical protein
MRTHTRTRSKILAGVALMAMTISFAARPVIASQKTPKPPVPPVEAVRKTLLKLPYYGVFDFLSYKYDNNGVVTLMGYSYRGTLKSDAERAVKRIPEVTSVVNKIDELRIYDDRSCHATPLAAACCGVIDMRSAAARSSPSAPAASPAPSPPATTQSTSSSTKAA